jgi:hypothetical protein
VTLIQFDIAFENIHDPMFQNRALKSFVVLLAEKSIRAGLSDMREISNNSLNFEHVMMKYVFL